MGVRPTTRCPRLAEHPHVPVVWPARPTTCPLHCPASDGTHHAPHRGDGGKRVPAALAPWCMRRGSRRLVPARVIAYLSGRTQRLAPRHVAPQAAGGLLHGGRYGPRRVPPRDYGGTRECGATWLELYKFVRQRQNISAVLPARCPEGGCVVCCSTVCARPCWVRAQRLAGDSRMSRTFRPCRPRPMIWLMVRSGPEQRGREPWRMIC